jgi:Family of unknown function (DUF6064)
MIPFSSEVYFALYYDYNLAIWPAQALAYLLGLSALLLARYPFPASDRLVLAILAAGWLWSGHVFVGRHLSSLLWAAWIFEAVFVLEALALLAAAVAPSPLRFRLRPDNESWTAAFVLLFCAVFYPVFAAQASGHVWPATQLIGVAPAPTAVLTIGFLLLARSRWALGLAVVPAAYLVVTAYLGWQFAITEDLVLVAVGLAGLVVLILARRKALH